MMKEDGFVLPLSLMIIFIIIATALSFAVSYKVNLHFVQDQKQMLALDRLEQCAYADISQWLNNGQMLHEYEMLLYEEGNVQLSLYREADGQRTYEISATVSEEYKRKSWLVVDNKTHHIIKWVEGS